MADLARSDMSLPGLQGGLPQLEALLDRRNMPEPGRAFVRDAFTTDPKRRVGGGSRNTRVRFTSRKMGCVIQCESRTLEGAFARLCEHDPKILLYLCQPIVVQIRTRPSEGSARTSHVTLDYLVYHEDHGWMLVECKPQSELEKRDRFVRDGDSWRYPALERAVADLGLKVWVYSSEEINSVWLRNVGWLADYVGTDCPARALCDQLLERVRKARSIRVSTLLELLGDRTDALWWLVANNHLAADLEGELLHDRDWAWVHDSPERAIAWRTARAESDLARAELASRPSVVRIEADARLTWDGVPWRVLNRGADKVTLQREDPTDKILELRIDDVHTLLKRGSLRAQDEARLDKIRAAREARVLRASPKELRAALHRYEALAHYHRTGKPPTGVSRKSIERYAAAVERGRILYLSAFIGLISLRGRPRGIPRLAPAQRQAIDAAVKAYRDDESAGFVAAAYATLLENWSHLYLEAPSYDTLRRAINAIPRSELARGRRGRREAIRLEGPVPALDYATPPHGDRVWAVGEIDHTPLDLSLVSSVTGAVLGTAYLSVLLDAFTRIPLAFVLRFGAPRRYPVLELLHECVRRHGRVPDYIVVDDAPEFSSNDVEMAFALLDISKIERATGRPKQGAVIERMFGISNQRMTHQLRGNTEPNTLGRGLSASHRPSRFAVWTLQKAHQACAKFFFELCPALTHGTLGGTVGEVYEHSMALAGERVARHVMCDLALRALLAETPKSGGPTRKVDGSRGIFVEYLRYWHPLFNRGDVAGTSVEVRVFPDDCGVVLARVHGEWRRCELRDGGYDFAGRSRRQIEMAVAVLRQQHRIGRSRAACLANAKIIGAFLAHLGETEAECAIKLQNLRDQENALAAASAPLAADASPLRLAAVDGKPVGPSDVVAPPSQRSASQAASAALPECIDFDDLEALDED